MRFEVRHDLCAKFSDEEIDEALRELRPAALPFLLDWLGVEPSPIKRRLNELLYRQR